MTQVMPQMSGLGPSLVRTGPMPATGRWGWYRDHEGNEFQRVSSLIKYVETDTYNLEQWMKRQVAEGLAIRDDLVLAVKAMGRPDPVHGWSQADKAKLNGIVKDASEAAKQADGGRKGTAVHDLTERLDRGEDIEAVVRGLPAGPAQSLRAYDFLRRENGWRSVEIERTVVCDELSVAGTFDRVDLIPGLAALLGPGDCQYGHGAGGEMHFEATLGHGEMSELPVINDVKTEKDPTLNGLHIAPQAGIYSRAKRMWRPTGGLVPLLDKDGAPRTYERSGDPIMVPAGEYVPAPCVRQDVAVITHILDGTAEPLFVDLNEGWEAARAARAQADRQARAKRSGGWFVPVPGVKRPDSLKMFVNQMVAAQPAAIRPSENGCNNCAPWVAGASASRVDGTDNSTPCTSCGSTAGNPNMQPLLATAPWDAAAAKGPGVPAGPSAVGVDGATAVSAQPMSDGTTHYAVQRGDGLTEWRTEPPVGTQVTVAGVGFTKVDTVDNIVRHGVLDEVDKSAIEVVWAAVDMGGLAKVYEIYTGTVGRPWGGRVQEAADARRRQIECPQRALHTGGKCSCGWTAGIPA